MMLSSGAGAFLRTTNASCGALFDCFYAFTYWRGAFWSANRRHRMFEPDRWPNDDASYTSRIILTEWYEEPIGLVPLREVNLGPGNDPRIALVGGRPIVLFRGTIHDKEPYYLYDVAAEKMIPIKIKDQWFTYGKNWVPFDDNGQLGAVHSVSPVRLLRIDPASGIGRVTSEHENSFDPKAAHDDFSMLRGGTNARKLGGRIIGLGHATFRPWRHHPFAWVIEPDGTCSTLSSADFDPMVRAGFGIIDPTSLIELPDGRLFIGVCGSERDWFFDQSFVEALLPSTLSTSEHGVRLTVDASVFDSFAPTVSLIASDLPTGLPTTIVPYGGRYTIPQEGFLSFGPYTSLAAGRYRLTFRYRADGPPETECGWADGCVCIPGYASSLGKITLFGTSNETRRVSLDIDVALASNERFSIQVHLNGALSVTIYDVKVALVLI